jgi:hypothetical protein
MEPLEPFHSVWTFWAVRSDNLRVYKRLALPNRCLFPSSRVTYPVIKAFTVLKARFPSRAATPGIVLGRSRLIGPRNGLTGLLYLGLKQIPVIEKKNLRSVSMSCAAGRRTSSAYSFLAPPAPPFLLRLRRRLPLPAGQRS